MADENHASYYGVNQLCVRDMVQRAIQMGSKNKNQMDDIYVDLTHKQLTCVPVPNIHNHRVRFVYMNHNNIQGTIDLNPLFRAWCRLHSLQITWNKINTIKNVVSSLPNPAYNAIACRTSCLRELNLSMNRLTTLPEGMPQSLEKINVSNNRIERLPFSFSNLSNLTHLWMDRNCLHVSECNSIVALMRSKLKVLSMSNNPLCDFPLPSDIKNNIDIEELYLNDCKIDHIPDSLYNYCSNLHILSLSMNAVKTIGDSISNLINLHTLNVSNCAELCHISQSVGNLKKLRRLDIEFCKGIHKLPSLPNIMNIRFIGLKGTHMKRIPIAWGENQRLRVSFHKSNAMLKNLFKIYKSIKHGTHAFRICVCNYVCNCIQF